MGHQIGAAAALFSNHQYIMATNTAEKLDEILLKLQDIEQRMAARAYIDGKVQEHDAFINGNGKPGAKSQLAVMGWINSLLFAAILIDIVTRWLGG